jgi:hypothetical protein
MICNEDAWSGSVGGDLGAAAGSALLLQREAMLHQLWCGNALQQHLLERRHRGTHLPHGCTATTHQHT